MKIGDLVKSCDPWETQLGIVVEVEPGRIGQDLMAREIKVYYIITIFVVAFWNGGDLTCLLKEKIL